MVNNLNIAIFHQPEWARPPSTPSSDGSAPTKPSTSAPGQWTSEMMTSYHTSTTSTTMQPMSSSTTMQPMSSTTTEEPNSNENENSPDPGANEVSCGAKDYLPHSDCSKVF